MSPSARLDVYRGRVPRRSLRADRLLPARYATVCSIPRNPGWPTCYRPVGALPDGRGRDRRRLYGERIAAYFAHHDIELTVFRVDRSARPTRRWTTAERIVDAFGDFGLMRKEPVLVVGGGLTTDVAGFACSMFRRATNYIRIPTTLIGLIDASVAIKVAVNHGRAKNRLGRLPRLAAGAARLLLPRDAADRAGAQRHGRADQDRGRGQQRHLRAAGEVRRGPAGHPLRAPRRDAGAARDRRPDHATTRSARCSSSRCRTCTSSTSTG